MHLPKIFCDRMVLQANKPTRVFGEANGLVEIFFLGERYAVNAQGAWEIILPSYPYGGPYEMTIAAEGEKVRFIDVMIGEVILCAGQSNLQFTLENEDEWEHTENSALRTFVSERLEEYVGIKSDDGWVSFEGENRKYWSSLGYHLAKLIHQEWGVAVGIVGCWQGASNIQSWLPKSIALQPRFQVNEKEACSDYRSKWYQAWNQPGKLFEKAFLPIAPYTFVATVWYQGESNTSIVEGKIYADMLTELVFAWRKNLKDESLPFKIVQICDFDTRNDEGWRGIQRAQIEAIKGLKFAELITSSDVCEHLDIHPKHKDKLAKKIYMSIYSKTDAYQ